MNTEFADIDPLCDGDERLILTAVRKYLAGTDSEAWHTVTYRNAAGNQHCALSHIQTMLPDDADGMRLMERFENVWSPSCVIGVRANDGKDPDSYPQATAKERSLAFIDNLISGSEDSTIVGMEKTHQAWSGDHG